MAAAAAGGRAQLAQDFVSDVFGYDFNDLALVQEAIDTTGLSRIRSTEANKRLAMIGDKALESTIISTWYPTGAPRGDCSRQVQSRLCNDNMATIAQQIGLEHHLILHPGHIGIVSRKTLATGLEAIFGAIYQDCGEKISIIRAVMESVGV